MAIGWLSVLKSVPWADVVSNAPKVASGAKKLWNAVGKKAPEIPVSTVQPPVIFSSEVQTLGTLQLRIGALEAASVDLRSQMAASSGLIKELAEQNTQLILRIETLRKRLMWFAGLLVVIGCVAASNLVRN